VWAIANVVYIDLRRKGERGFGRVLSFFAGMPTTFIALLVVREGWAPRIHPPADDEDRLLREIKIDRARRERTLPGSDAPEDDEGSEQRPES
jgi:hypothetical protein